MHTGLSKQIRHFLLAVGYAFMSYLAMPGANAVWFVLIAFLPIFYLCDKSDSLKQFLFWAWFGEFLKWTLISIWLRHVSWFAVLGVALPVSLFQLSWFALCWMLTRNSKPVGIPAMLALAVFWGATEILRTQPLGVPGANLSVSLWRHPEWLQLSSIISSYGVSSLLFFLNGCNYLILKNLYFREFRMLLLQAMFVSSIVISVYGFGMHRMASAKIEVTKRETIDLAFVQPKQPAYLVWDLEKMQAAVTTVFRLTSSVDKERTDLILWPEGTLPWPISRDNEMSKEVSRLVRFLERPLLLGNMFREGSKDYNAVLKYDSSGTLSEQFYAKMILVPFGEYVPFARLLGAFETIVPLPGAFSPGESDSLINVDFGDKKVNIGALVCYEDCYSFLALDRARQGGDFIYVATYNVWYGEEFGAYIHAAHSVIRAIETGRPVVRCGSAGWSGVINEVGEVEWLMQDSENSIYFQGVGYGSVSIREQPIQTLYTKTATLVIAVQILLAAVLPAGLIAYKKLLSFNR
jgi:apolipoprotein N-acyltransferase